MLQTEAEPTPDYATDVYKVILDKYINTHTINISDELRGILSDIDSSNIYQFYNGNNRILSARSSMSMIPIEMLYKNPKKHINDTLQYNPAFNQISAEITHRYKEGYTDSNLLTSFSNLTQNQISKLPGSIQNIVYKIWRTCIDNGQDFSEENGIQLFANFYNNQIIKNFLNLIGQLSDVTYFIKNPNYVCNSTTTTENDIKTWLMNDTPDLQTELEKAMLATLEIKLEDTKKRFATYDGKKEELSILLEYLPIEETKLRESYTEIQSTEYWQNFLKYWNFISPLEEGGGYYLFKLLLGRYKKGDVETEILHELNEIFKLINYDNRNSIGRPFLARGMYEETYRRKGKHSVALKDFSYTTFAHETAHTLNAAFPVGELPNRFFGITDRRISSTGNTNTGIVRVIEEACSFIAPQLLVQENVDIRNHIRTILDPLSQNVYPQIYKFIRNSPEIKEEIISLLDKIPLEPSKFVKFMDEFNFLTTSLWAAEISEQELKDVILALINTDYRYVKKVCREKAEVIFREVEIERLHSELLPRSTPLVDFDHILKTIRAKAIGNYEIKEANANITLLVQKDKFRIFWGTGNTLELITFPDRPIWTEVKN